MTEFPTKTFSIVDPRMFDGDPFEVAQRACLQSAALAGILAKQIELTTLMARNAELERQIIAGEDPDVAKWDEGAQAKTLAKLLELSTGTERRLAMIAQAAGYNPRHPPKET